MEHKIMTPKTCKKRIEDPVKHQMDDCPICDWGLKVCEVCGKAEMDLIDFPDCPGPKPADNLLTKDYAGERMHDAEIRKATNDYMLTCVAEECAEIGKEAAKGIRFGLHDKWHDKPTAHDAVIAEFYDLVAVMEMMFEAGILSKPSDKEIEEMIHRKRSRVRHFMEYSAERGYIGDKI